MAVTYRLVQHWSGGIIGKYTIANESNAVLSGWQFTATFPGDQVQFVIGAADPDLGSDVLVLEPSSAGAQIAPGGRVSVIFFAARADREPGALLIQRNHVLAGPPPVPRPDCPACLRRDNETNGDPMRGRWGANHRAGLVWLAAPSGRTASRAGRPAA